MLTERIQKYKISVCFDFLTKELNKYPHDISQNDPNFIYTHYNL